MEQTNIRHLSLDRCGGKAFELVVADLSFISLRTVAPVLLGPITEEGADVVVLIKPQFEAGRAAASAGRGVIRDPAVWSETLRRVITTFIEQRAAMMGLMVSPVTGADGNVEFLAHFRAQRQSETGVEEQDIEVVVDEATNRYGVEHR